jgi:3-hydroxymyristoyl/3-hydroxydecanoyl-(acyl carrier protein) dehydratase
VPNSLYRQTTLINKHIVERETLTGEIKNIYEGFFHFDPDDGIYRTHFPMHPVVPGSVIVQAFIEAAQRHMHIKEYTIERFGFRHFVTPGEYPFSIQLLENRLKCALYSGENILVTGTFRV